MHLYKRVCPSVRPSVCWLVGLLVGLSVGNPFFFAQQKWEKMVKSDFPYLCRLPLSTFCSQSVFRSPFHNLSFATFLSLSFFIIFLLQYFSHQLTLTFFFHNFFFLLFSSQSFLYHLFSQSIFCDPSFTIFLLQSFLLSLQNVGRMFVRSRACFFLISVSIQISLY